jgi:peroxiredoxin
VRFSRFYTLLLVLALALAQGCNRGAHPAQTGEVAPDFTVADGSTTVHLASYRGQVVLLNFWATWCPPCVAEMPSMLMLHHDMPKLAILAVSVDEDPDAYSSFIARRHVDLITVRDPNETYVIDRKGVIRRKFVGPQDWSSPEVRDYLKSL